MKFKFAKKATLLVSAMALAGMAWAQQKPAELKVGITTFLSGPASVFGVPAKAAAEILIDDINKNPKKYLSFSVIGRKEDEGFSKKELEEIRREISNMTLDKKKP